MDGLDVVLNHFKVALVCSTMKRYVTITGTAKWVTEFTFNEILHYV